MLTIGWRISFWRSTLLFEDLLKYAESGSLPMHMPGHKRNTTLLGSALPYKLDITEISGFDDLHDMRGVLRNISGLAGELYDAEHAFPMVNGTTGGILAAVRAACTAPGGSIVMSRFSHKSVYNAAELNVLTPVYLTPKRFGGGVSADDIKLALQNANDVRCVVITSPTYEGAVSDIAAIAGTVHEFGVPLIVDAAHGAHFGFSEFFPLNATRLGADVEIVSLHKTLPALTQSSLLLAGHDSLIPATALEQQLRVFETSSPSYVLLASIDRCLTLLRENGAELFKAYEENLRWFYDITRGLNAINVSFYNDCSAYDSGKLVFNTIYSDISGIILHTLLRDEYKIELEMAMPNYALAMTSICDTRASFERLAVALIAIDKKLKPGKQRVSVPFTLPQRVKKPFEARFISGEPVLLKNAVGKLTSEYLWCYPPGVPLLVPGEIIDDNLLRYISWLESSGIILRSDSGRLPEIICARDNP